MIVVDTNLVAYTLIAGEKTAQAREMLARDPDWRLPSLWRHEFLNVLATYARQGHATAAQARGIWVAAVTRFSPAEEPVDAEAALAIAVEHPVSAYDAQFVALARRLRAPLVTEDRRLQRCFPALAVSMREFLATAR